MGGLAGPAPPPLSRYGTFAAVVQNDSPPIAALKRQLLLGAIDKSPRLRTDLDLLVITQYFATLDSLTQVSPQALHYLATECTSMTLQDGDVFCYQEDGVVVDSNALVIVEGSLCGYFNKAFSQRDDATELFTSWNARQNRKRGVLVDFGDFQTTYAAGALCGFDDLLVGFPNLASSSSDLLWYRRKGIHAQEQTRAISFKKDTLDRAAQRYGLAVERGVLYSQREAASTDVSHVAIFSAFSETSKQALLHHAPRRLVLRGDTLFQTPRDPSSVTITAVAIVLSGRLDIYWTGDATPPDGRSSTSTPDTQPPTTPKPSSAMTFTTPLFSVRRGQTIGDQTLGLALDQLSDPTSWPTSTAPAPDASATLRHALNRLPIRIVSGEDSTEVLLVPLALYAEKRAEDHALHDYAAQLHHERWLARQPVASASSSSMFAAWAPPFFAATTPVARSLRDLHELLWRLRVDAAMAKAFFQLPPLVLERVCHAVELVHFDAPVPSLVLEEGCQSDAMDEVYVVAQGALRGISPTDGAQHDVFVAGDVFGLAPRSSPTVPVFADPDTMLLAVPRICVERWLQPVLDTLVLDAGSLFQRQTAYIAAHPPRLSLSHEKRKSLTAMARRASAQAANDDHSDASSATSVALATAHTDALATLLQRMGVMAFVPHTVLRELLTQCSIVHKHAGEIVCHENEATATLVAVLSGFVRVFSLEHMGAAIDMFRDHSFCQFMSLHHLLTKQEGRHEDGADGGGVRSSGSGSAAEAAPSVLTRHRSAMYGVHLQTLHALNAFRTGVLHERTQSPATVVAQTPCVLLVVNEAAYTEILKTHAPGVDLAPYHVLASVGPPPATESESTAATPTSGVVSFPNGPRALLARPVPAPLARFIETLATTPLAWLAPLSSAKRQLVLRHAKLLALQPGDRVLRHGDVVDHVVVVVRGALALFVRQHHDRVATALDASQRSVRSLMLERHVTSNYSTTSHQLSSLDASTPRGADPRRLQHKRAMLQQKVSRMVAGAPPAELASATGPTARHPTPPPLAPPPAGTASASSSLFVQSVVAAVREDKRKKSSLAVPPARVDGTVAAAGGRGVEGTSPRKSATALTLHAAVSRATLAHRLDQRRSGNERGDGVSPLSSRTMRTTHRSALAGGDDGDEVDDDDGDGVDGVSHPTRGSTLLCHLRAGDVYGEEALASSAAVYRSLHDVFAETASAAASPSGATVSLGASASTLPSPVAAVELLCIPRAALLAVLRKSDDEVEQEIRGRARAAKSKWQLAEQIVVAQKRNSLTSAGGATGVAATPAKKMPKLFDLFKNILNQRYYITMRAIAEIPLLQDLSDDAKREICAGARFEAVERFVNVYKDDVRAGDAQPTVGSQLRYYIVLSGRVGLFPKSAVHGTGGGGGNGANATMSFGAGGTSSGGGPAAAVTGKHGFVVGAGATASSHHYAGLSGSIDACLVEVGVGRGFGELELLAPEASRHHMLAVALEPTKLLSLPGELFLRHWPQVRDMERHIAYLRGGAFARLEMEKTASLYHALRHESYDRGARVLEQHQPLLKSEVVFLKHGECSVQTTVALRARTLDDDDGGDPTDDGSNDQAVRVLATIADVRAGHVVWLAAPGRVPFTLLAVSSRVEVARVGVDKLRAVLPKSHLAQLEESCELLAARYREQLTRARRTIVRAMNDKRSAELRRATSDGATHTFLPTLHYAMQAATRKSQLQARVHGATRGRGRTDSTIGPKTDETDQRVPAIPYARVLASKPIDLARVQAEERAELRRRRQTTEPDVSADSDGSLGGLDSPTNTRRETELDAAYRAAHAREHYELVASANLPGTTLLRGSFPDDPSLRRRRQVARQTSSGGPIMPPLESTATPSANSGKVDEVSVPETVTGVPREGTGKVETKLKKKNSFSVNFYGDAAEWDAVCHGDDSNRDVDLAVDLRALLQAELQSPMLPLRSIKLAPSGCKLHSMGKYVDLVGAPPNQQADHHHQPSPPHSLASPTAVPTISIPRVLCSGWSATPPRREPRAPSLTPPGSEPSRTVARRQGFLQVLEVPANARDTGFAQDQFLRAVVHRLRRRLVVLDDATLCEFAEDTPTAHTSTPPTSRALRVVRLTPDTLVRDAPLVAAGEGDVVLRHSFVLDAGSLVLLLTCESLVDKTNWMLAIRSAAAMGAPPPLIAPAAHAENGSPGSPKFKHRQSVALSLANRETRRLSMAGPSLAGRNAIVQEETVLEVEYRIS